MRGPCSKPLQNLECVTVRSFHLYFMQNGSCEGCKLEGSAGVSRREAPVEEGGVHAPLFPQRGWTQVSLGGGGAPALCYRHGEGRLPTPFTLLTWVVLSKKVIPYPRPTP